MQKIIFVLIVLSSFWINASAASLDADQAFGECIKKSEGITLKMVDCQEAYLSRLNKELYAALKEISKKLDENETKRLQNYQEQWENWRQSHCDFSTREGSIQLINSMFCFLQVTKDRIDMLSHRTLESNRDLAVCVRRAGKIQSLETLCLQENYERVDKRLYQVWVQVRAFTPSRTLHSEEQRKWMEARDKQCGSPAFSDVYSAYDYYNCMTEKTEARIRELLEPYH